MLCYIFCLSVLQNDSKSIFDESSKGGQMWAKEQSG